MAASAADRLTEATKPVFPESSLARALRETKSPLERLGLKGAFDGLTGTSAFDKSVRDLASAQDRLKSAFGPPSIAGDALSRAMDQALASTTRSVFDDMPPMLDLPPNPIFETNEHLEQAVRKIDALLDVQAKQADLTGLVLSALVEGGKAQARLAIGGLVIGFIGVLVAIIAIAV